MARGTEVEFAYGETLGGSKQGVEVETFTSNAVDRVSVRPIVSAEIEDETTNTSALTRFRYGSDDTSLTVGTLGLRGVVDNDVESVVDEP